MLTASDIPPERWQETGVFSICETQAELFLTVQRLLGLPAVEQLLIDTKADATRETLRAAANELARVGLKPVAALVRKHARRAKPKPQNFKTRWRR
jgi:hypothetical protein